MATDAAAETFFAIREEMSEPKSLRLAGGRALVFSSRSPGKSSDNEDTAALIPFGEGGALVIADGMGGQPGGALAASLAVQAVDASLTAAHESHTLRDGLLNGFEAANHSVQDTASGAATTLTAVQIQDRAIRPYHVGDSLILLVGQRGRIRLQTVPHSPVGYAVESGMLEEQEAMHHADRHLVSNMVGSPEMRIEIGSVYHLRPRDTLLLATDGLSDNLHTHEIVEIIRKGPLEKAAQALADTCRQRMCDPDPGHPTKPDDLTFILFRLDTPPRKRPRRSNGGTADT